MADSRRGKFLLFNLLLFFLSSTWQVSRVFATSDPVPIRDDQDSDEHNDVVFLGRLQAQLEKLEELVRNLTGVVARLESRLADSPKQSVGLQSTPAKGKRRRNLPGSVQESEARGKPIPVTEYSPFWTERFHFVSAARLSPDATCINVLPFQDLDGNSKFVAIGDEKGRISVFLRNGDLALEFSTMLESPITAFLSYMSVHKNESFVLTGHEDGEILMHRVWEQWNAEEFVSLKMATVKQFASMEIGEDKSKVNILEVRHVGRERYILSTDNHGRIRVFRENGVVYGSALPSRRPLAFLKRRLLFLTDEGAGSLDLRTMKIKESKCEGLNNSIARTYAFDAMERSKAYGFTSAGDLILVVLLGDLMNFKCRVRSMKKLEMGEPIVFHTIKGYLLALNHEKVSIYNVSSQHYGRVASPRLLFSTGLDEIKSSFLNYEAKDGDAQRKMVKAPLLATDGEKLVVLSLGDGYIGKFRSNLPVYKGEFGTILWTSPVLFFILFLFGAWHFFAKKKEALTSWGPDDSFGSASAGNGAPTGSGFSDVAFAGSCSRDGDVVDIRGGGLRGPSRGYPSSFGARSAEHEPRLAAVDPNFRAASELKFRGSNIKSVGFQKRIEGLFADSRVVDDVN